MGRKLDQSWGVRSFVRSMDGPQKRAGSAMSWTLRSPQCRVLGAGQSGTTHGSQPVRSEGAWARPGAACAGVIKARCGRSQGAQRVDRSGSGLLARLEASLRRGLVRGTSVALVGCQRDWAGPGAGAQAQAQGQSMQLVGRTLWWGDESFSCVVKTQRRWSNKIYKTELTKTRYNNQVLGKYRVDP